MRNDDLKGSMQHIGNATNQIRGQRHAMQQIGNAEQREAHLQIWRVERFIEVLTEGAWRRWRLERPCRWLALAEEERRTKDEG